MICKNCGTEFEEGIFCPECGYKNEENEVKDDNIDIFADNTSNNELEPLSDEEVSKILEDVKFYYETSYKKKEYTIVDGKHKFYDMAQEALINALKTNKENYELWWELSKPIDYNDPEHEKGVQETYSFKDDYFEKAIKLAGVEDKKRIMEEYDDYETRKKATIDSNIVKEKEKEEKKRIEFEKKKEQELQEQRAREAQEAYNRKVEKEKMHKEEKARAEQLEKEAKLEAERSERIRLENERLQREAALKKQQIQQEKMMKKEESKPVKMAWILSIIGWVVSFTGILTIGSIPLGIFSVLKAKDLLNTRYRVSAIFAIISDVLLFLWIVTIVIVVVLAVTGKLK